MRVYYRFYKRLYDDASGSSEIEGEEEGEEEGDYPGGGEVNAFGRCGVDAPLPRTPRKTCKYTCKIHVRGELHGRVARELRVILGAEKFRVFSLSPKRRVEEILIRRREDLTRFHEMLSCSCRS